MYRSGEGRISTPVVRHLRRRSSEPPVLPTCRLAQAVQQLALVLCDDADDASPELTLSTRSWFPTALLLAVAVTARAWAALRVEEATLCRELQTTRLPVSPVPVGYCWQNSRCCQSVLRKQHSYIGDIVSHPNTEL